MARRLVDAAGGLVLIITNEGDGWHAGWKKKAGRWRMEEERNGVEGWEEGGGPWFGLIERFNREKKYY